MLATGVTAVGGFGVNLFLALILSYLLLLEKKKINKVRRKAGGTAGFPLFMITL